jgi:uncharacterized protein YbjT (DUF2867 family)
VRIFIAGATGAVGKRLVPMLTGAGHIVIATTTTPAKQVPKQNSPRARWSVERHQSRVRGYVA